MIYSKSNPVGLDKKIKLIQTKLESEFVAYGLATDDFDIYDRIYKLKEDTEIVPAKFINQRYEKSLFSNDKVLTCYFYKRTEPQNAHGLFSVTVGNIFHVNLSLFYPASTGRSDQEFSKRISDIYAREPYGFRLMNFTGDIEKVFSDLRYSTTLEDMQPYFSVRFDLNINYRI